MIIGPVDTKARLEVVSDSLMPGIDGMTPKFPIEYVELETLRQRDVGVLKITNYPANHTKQTNPTAVRIKVGGKVIAYSGDGD